MPVNSPFSIFHSPLSIILLWVVFAFRPEAILPKAGSQPESQPESISLEARVLALLASAGPMSKSALSAALGQKEVSGHLNQLMRRLVADQWVAYTIPNKPQSRLQKYRLTAEGRVRLMENGEWKMENDLG